MMRVELSDRNQVVDDCVCKGAKPDDGGKDGLSGRSRIFQRRLGVRKDFADLCGGSFLAFSPLVFCMGSGVVRGERLAE